MLRQVLLAAIAVPALALACVDGATEYEVIVQFNTSVTQEDLEEADRLLRAYDDDLDFLIQESFPPTGRAFLETDAPDFCPTVEAQLEAKSYVDDATCEEE